MVRLFNISHYSQFREFSYLSFDILLSKYRLSTSERSLIFKHETLAILKLHCLKFWPSPHPTKDSNMLELGRQ